MQNKILWATAIAFFIGGLAMIGAVNEVFALWVGVGLVVTGVVIGLFAWKHKEVKQMHAGDKLNIIRNTEIEAKVKDAKKAIGADFEGDYELDKVKVKLEAEHVEEATGARFTSSNGSTPLTLSIMSCSRCGKNFPKTFTGHLPEETACPHCGHMNKVEK
jgi:hypothetical protein